MIDDIALRKIATEEKIPLGTIEKDYAISCALSKISNSRLNEHLIFKGGTAINKIYYPEARFSEDMDFTVLFMSKEEALYSLKEIFDNTRIESISYESVYEERSSQTGKRVRSPLTGPLQFRNSIRVDLSFRNDLILDIKIHIAPSKYGESISSKIKVLDFIEIMSEKLRALMSRVEPRDYYDVWAHIDKIQDKSFLRNLTKRK